MVNIDFTLTLPDCDPVKMKDITFESWAQSFPCLKDAPISPWDPERLANWAAKQGLVGAPVETVRLLLHLYGCEDEHSTKDETLLVYVDNERAKYNPAYAKRYFTKEHQLPYGAEIGDARPPKTKDVYVTYSTFPIGPFCLGDVLTKWSDGDFHAFIGLMRKVRFLEKSLDAFREIGKGGGK